MSVKTFTWLLSFALHAALALAFINFETGGSFESGESDDLLKIEQGIAIEGLATLGRDEQTVEAIDAMPLEASEARPEIEEIETETPVEQEKPPEEIEAAELPDDTEIVSSPNAPEAEAIPPAKPEVAEIEQPQPEQLAAVEQSEQIAVEEQNAAGEAKSGGDAAAKNAYFGKLRKHLERRKVNPRTRQSGTVVVRFTVDATGQILSREIVTSSGSKALDDAAVASLDRAAPFPPFAANVSGEPLVVSVPFRFLTR